MRRRDCISTLPLAFFAFVLIALLGGCGGIGGSPNAPTPTPTPPTVNPPAPSTSEHLVYALSGNQVFVFDAHPAQGTLQSVAGPIATTLMNGAAIAFAAPQRVLFATGFVCMPRGDCGNSMAVLSTSNPKAPSLLNAQSTQDTTALLVDNTGLLPIGLDPVNAFQSWRYDPAAHTFTAVGALQAFQTGDGPSIMLHPSQQVVIGVTSVGAANGPFSTFVNSFHRDPGSGILTKSATLTLADEAGNAAMTPDGRFVLVPDTSTGAVNIVAVDGSTGALALAGTSSSAGAFLLYQFIDATHVLGRLKVNNSDRLTIFTFNGTTLTAGATLDLAGSGSLLSVTSVGNTIYVASTAALQMIAFDPASGSLRSIATANTVASSIAVNPVTP
jgi:hypothetical protein